MTTQSTSAFLEQVCTALNKYEGLKVFHDDNAILFIGEDGQKIEGQYLVFYDRGHVGFQVISNAFLTDLSYIEAKRHFEAAWTLVKTALQHGKMDVAEQVTYHEGQQRAETWKRESKTPEEWAEAYYKYWKTARKNFRLIRLLVEKTVKNDLFSIKELIG